MLNASPPRGSRRRLVSFIAALAAPTIALAQSGPTASPPATRPAPADALTDGVVITATRLPTPASQVGSSVTIITGEEIARRQQPLVSDVLRTVPGLDVARSGGNNQITSVFTRGAESSHTLVLIDGIEANDPTSPNRAFDFSTLTADNIERIEVLRGPQSTLWGSNAMGGVINIITKRGEGKPTGYVFAEAGRYRTYREGAGISGGTADVNYSLSLSQQNSKGFSAADAIYGNRENDGYGISTISTRLGWNVSQSLDIDFIARYQHSRIDIDDFGGPGGDDPSRRLKNDQAFFRIQPHLLLDDGKWEQTFGFSYTLYNRDDNDNAFPDQINGGIARLDYQSDYHFAKNHTLTLGMAADEENFASNSSSRRYADSLGLFVQDAISFADKLYLTAGVRYEDHSISDTSWTYRATAAYFLTPTTRTHASLGTGFKSPSLSNLYSSFGDPNLKPEKSRGWDVGVEQKFFDGRLSADVTYFRNQFEDLIDYDFVANKLQNFGNATTQGLEATLTARPVNDLALSLSYTYTDTLNTDTDKELLRRAPHKISASANWRYVPRGDITVTMVYSSSRADIDPVTFGRSRVGAYTLLDVATSYRVTDNVTLYARVDNALDQNYEEVAGFGTAAISVFGGVKISF